MQRWTNRGRTTLPQLMEQAVAKWPDRVFLDFAGDKHTYREIDIASNRAAHGLAALGVGAGDCVCVMLDNVVELVITWFAANKLGAIFVPFNTTYKGEYLRNQIADTAGSVMFLHDKYLDWVLAVSDRTPDLRTLVCVGDVPQVETHLSIVPFASALSDDQSAVQADVGTDDPAIILYTSGTTGPSKGGVIAQS